MSDSKNNNFNNIMIGCLCAVTAESIFGFSYVFSKTATSVASPFTLLAWRFFLAFMIMSILVLVKVVKVNYKGKKYKQILAILVFDPVIYLTCETIGINHTTASESGIFLACIPVAALVASTLMLHKKPSKIQIVGILITLCGVIATVLAVGISSSLSVIGYICLSLGVVSYALYNVYVDKASSFTDTEITYAMIATGAAVFIPLAIIEGFINGNVSYVIRLPFIDNGFLVSILYQGILGSLGAIFLSNIAISKIGVNRTSSFIGVSTVVSMLAGAVILKETISTGQLIAAAIIILGIYIANMNIKKYNNSR